ncbi:ABC transporter six-transmembrane domain-containing protein [Campylobacter sp. VBCF_05 NA6]|uniref:ABC transporter six-transmembrane domain-containing protein n=1 Tax=unclassified Campylobacter TaxID=2593542 RepID=UPI0022E9CE74|nr:MULTISPECIES: ABC transporter six-transmembrane domain-containing protein [unclassified Campylobacter]MDA3057285.1 ABC transporter six-transmembrane domain-containing protein [Campylobacter sp. VBCF_04 NA7]MDA3059143.1 ABC transporter six-transmembrane domain-containing protein [Campylobacter sp. VBCF_05 NA6]
MQKSAFKTLIFIALKHYKKLIFTFSLVILENLAFMLYPIFGGFAINKILAGEAKIAIIYIFVIFGIWFLGAIRRKIDTYAFSKIYANLAVNIISNERSSNASVSQTSARVALSREFINFFEHSFPMLFTSVVSILGSVFMLYFYEPIVASFCLIIVAVLAPFLPRYIRKNDRFYLKLNNRNENEVNLIEKGSPIAVLRHYDLLSRIRTISNREAIGYLIVGSICALAFSLAAYLLAVKQTDAGYIFTVMNYIWTFAISLDDAPRLIEEFSQLKDIGKRVNALENDDKNSDEIR